MPPKATAFLKRGSSSPAALALLAVGLVALAFGAGAVGWAIGHGTSKEAQPAAEPTTTAAETTVPQPKGDPVAGKAVFVDAGCGSCHALAATGATATVGPNLDQSKLSASEVLDWVVKGKGAMPSYKGRLSQKELDDLAVFLAK